MADLLQIIIKMLADHFCIGKTDIGDSKAVDHLRKSSLLSFIKAGHQVLKGFLPESVHLHDLITMLSNLKNISEIMNKASCNEFLQCCF